MERRDEIESLEREGKLEEMYRRVKKITFEKRSKAAR